MSLAIRAARPADGALIFSLVRELADYEKMSAEVDATQEKIAAALFCRSRGYSAKSRCGMERPRASRHGFSIIQLFEEVTAYLLKIYSCAPRIVAAVSARG